MKGISLPINILIIVIVAVIVLLGVMALYMGNWMPFNLSMNAETAKTQACKFLLNGGCGNTQNIKLDGTMGNLPEFDADLDGRTGALEGATTAITSVTCGGTSTSVGDNLASLCKCHFGIDDESSCKRMCGC